MAWTEDELHSLERLLETRLRDKRTSPIEMNQAQEKRHSTEQEEQHFTQPGEPEQGSVPVQEQSGYSHRSKLGDIRRSLISEFLGTLE